MPLSDEGVRLLTKGAILVVVILVTACVRTMVGPNPKRHRRMALGTVGGIAGGIAVASPLSTWFGTDVSALSALGGLLLGWTVAYQFMHHIPREAHHAHQGRERI